MRIEEINKWIDEGGSPPEDLTQEEHRHLSRLGWSLKEKWHFNGQKWYEHHSLHGKFHGPRECWDEDGSLTKDHEYFYGNRIK